MCADRVLVKEGPNNWGRWGKEDERGALNLLTPEVVLAATRVCKTGVVYNLGLPIQMQGSAPLFAYRGSPQRLTSMSISREGPELSHVETANTAAGSR